MSNITSKRKQSGAALLAFMLILITGLSYLLVSKLNTNLIKVGGEERTRLALNQAKQALIGYAMTYPDTVNPDSGPGYLPCPDKDNDGDAEGSCTFGGTNNTVGRFPFKRLEMEDIRDSHGERLWYAISQNFRNNPKLEPLNSETPGDLSVDSTNDIVAVIIAPGAPLNGQNRNPADTNISNQIGNYLEDDNANLDTVFTNAGSGDFNDNVVFITRTELMESVEKRVLGEVAQKLNEYQSLYNAYPWLSPFTNPTVSTFKSTVDTWQGHIPYHWSEDTPGASNRNPFQSSPGWTWHTDVGTATGWFSGTVTADCLRNVDCSDGLFPPIVAVNASSINCNWSDKSTADCDTSGWVATTTVSCNQGCPANGTCTRIYRVEFPQYTGTSIGVNNPSASSVRTRDVQKNGSLPVQNRAVQILDTYTGLTPSSFCLLSSSYTIGSGYINFVSGTTGTIETTGIKYDIDIDDDELPEWFVKNEWHKLVYIAYPGVEDPPGSATVCTSGVNCLALNNAGNPDSINRGVVIIAGEALSTQDRVASPVIGSYFELDNNDADQVFIRSVITADFNDQIKVIATP